MAKVGNTFDSADEFGLALGNGQLNMRPRPVNQNTFDLFDDLTAVFQQQGSGPASHARFVPSSADAPADRGQSNLLARFAHSGNPEIDPNRHPAQGEIPVQGQNLTQQRVNPGGASASNNVNIQSSGGSSFQQAQPYVAPQLPIDHAALREALDGKDYAAARVHARNDPRLQREISDTKQANLWQRQASVPIDPSMSFGSMIKSLGLRRQAERELEAINSLRLGRIQGNAAVDSASAQADQRVQASANKQVQAAVKQSVQARFEALKASSAAASEYQKPMVIPVPTGKFDDAGAALTEPMIGFFDNATGKFGIVSINDLRQGKRSIVHVDGMDDIGLKVGMFPGGQTQIVATDQVDDFLSNTGGVSPVGGGLVKQSSSASAQTRAPAGLPQDFSAQNMQNFIQKGAVSPGASADVQGQLTNLIAEQLRRQGK